MSQIVFNPVPATPKQAKEILHNAWMHLYNQRGAERNTDCYVALCDAQMILMRAEERLET